jgi:hypothetical protein
MLLKLLRENIREERDLRKTSSEFRRLRIYDEEDWRRPDRKKMDEAKGTVGAPQARPVPSPLVGEG